MKTTKCKYRSTNQHMCISMQSSWAAAGCKKATWEVVHCFRDHFPKLAYLWVAKEGLMFVHRKGEWRDNIREGRRMVARVHKVVVWRCWRWWRRQNVVEWVVQHAAWGIKVRGWRRWRGCCTSPALLSRANVRKDVAQVEVGDMLRRCNCTVWVGCHLCGCWNAGAGHGYYRCNWWRRCTTVLRVSL